MSRVFCDLSVFKKLSHAVEETLVFFGGFGDEILGPVHLFDELAFLFGELGRGPHVDVDDEVADAPAVDFRQALPLQTKHAATLGAGGDLHLGFAFH